jgi:hypothetical protein
MVAAGLLLAGQGKEIFSEVVKNACFAAHDEAVGDYLWVCCCPASCDIPMGKPTAKGFTAGDMISCDMVQQPRKVGGCGPAAGTPPLPPPPPPGHNSTAGHPHRLLQASGSWYSEPATEHPEDWYFRQYREWKWPLLACPANEKTDLRIAMENRNIRDLSGPHASKIAGMPRLTAWMSGDPGAKSASISQLSDISQTKWTAAEPAAKADTTCKTQSDCLKMYIHEKENTMEIFAGVLLCVLFIEMLMTIATWHLGVRVTEGSGEFGMNSYKGGRELEEGVSAGDELDGYIKDTR